ncbi:Iron(III)-transport system permease protein sfuB [Thermus sp. CCB_US3_UF1]|uniref:ABC transporter permease n=1 Tax=Thermus sp. CCB_US3_UF1 TaxID=1111069 RepID=UPI0002389C88|nr:iron ABC transporter permease [Thermus sp. CCB_US3_UF1]AEV15423.1 Iron(III)-transport system permease protein sfuB [Thermus sp. CCB_US3_UF1]
MLQRRLSHFPGLLPFLVPALLTGGGVALPLLYLLLRALEAEGAALGEILFRPKNLELLGNTLGLLLGVLLLTTLLALPLAFLTTRTDLRGKRLLSVLLTLPLALPGYVGAYVLLAATGPGGLLPLPRPEGYWGALLVLSLLTYPYLFLSLRAAFLGLDPSLEEAARTLGLGPWRAFFQATFPQLLPALLSGYLVVGLHVLGDFGTVSLLRYETFSYAIYLQYNAAFDRVYAAWLALFLLGLTGGLLLLEGWLLRRPSLARTGKGAGRRARAIPLGPWAPLAYLLVLLPLLLALVLPFSALFHLASRFPREGFLGLGEAFLHSALAAGPAAFLAVGMALPLAYLAVRHPSPASRALERLAYLGYAIPPLAFALAWIFFSLRSLPFLYGTLPLLVLVLGFHFLAESLGPIRGALHQVPRRLEEAARTLGETPTGAFFRVTFPLLWRGAVAGGALAFIGAVKELPLTLLLAPMGYATLSTRVFSYTQEAMFAEAAPFALLIALLSAAFVGVLLWSERRF